MSNRDNSHAARDVSADLTGQTRQLIAAAVDLSDHDLRMPSRCPGWSRAHVLSHVARNADAFVRVLDAAALGESAPMYPSRASRDADIEAGSRRGAAAILADLQETAERLSGALTALPRHRLDQSLGDIGGGGRTAGDVAWLRWREVVLHHVDLDRGFTLTDAGPLVTQLLEDVVGSLAERPGQPGLALSADEGGGWQIGDAGTPISGTVAAITTWLTGRSSGADLRAAHLPILEAWA
jgi:maleylpyruvate isomerase